MINFEQIIMIFDDDIVSRTRIYQYYSYYIIKGNFVAYNIQKTIMKNIVQRLDLIRKLNYKEINQIGYTLIPQNTNIDVPEYRDTQYRKRRIEIGEMSKLHKMGEKITEVEYTQEQNMSWRTLLGRMVPLHQKVMCQKYLNNFKQLQEKLGFSSRIPKINDLSQFLYKKTGFLIKPAPGMISAREFLYCLSMRVFCCGQFIRHPQSLEFTVEPDIVHEYVGHVPMLADPIMAEISEKIGKMSIDTSQQKINLLGAAYLATIELGVCIEQGKIRAFGAGISACVSDLEKIVQNKFTTLSFTPKNFHRLRAVDYQKPFENFYLSNTFEDALSNLNHYIETIDCQQSANTSHSLESQLL